MLGRVFLLFHPLKKLTRNEGGVMESRRGVTVQNTLEEVKRKFTKWSMDGSSLF